MWDRQVGRGSGTGGATEHATGGAVGKRTLVEGLASAGDTAPSSGGAALPTAQQATFERSLGADLSSVRVHTGAASAQAAAGFGARAFATGQDIHFGAGQYQPNESAGVHLLAHEVAHTVQQRGGSAGPQAKLAVSQPGDSAEREADHFADHIVHGGPQPTLSAAPVAIHRQPAPTPAQAPPARALGDLRDPRQFPTYEEFAAAFAELGTFTASDTPGATHTTFRVLGDRAADDSSADAADHGVARRGSRAGEPYIDHPTASWVADHLPPELRMAVYELPADCADVAILLRHVWLFARGRTESYGRWTIGVGAGRTEAKRATSLTRLIRDDVYSGSVKAMISIPYASLSFAALEPMLHPGDVLVWAHHDPATGARSGGHTQTIQTISRDATGHITVMALLQGNQPIFADQAAEIEDDQRANHQTVTAASTLRDLPGRRIERGVLQAGDLQDISGIWTWSDDRRTSLVAAGPPSGVTRPATRRIAGDRRRRISDWSSSLSAAGAETIEGVFEAFLTAVRAGLESGSAQAAEIRSDAPGVGTSAGHRLARMKITAARRQELGSMLVAQARSMATHLNPGTGPDDVAVFTSIGDDVRDAAGITEATPPTASPAGSATTPTTPGATAPTPGPAAPTPGPASPP
ncbi:MAG: DUF4157 domain-containing protein [Kofleriaceae bacterium]